jgi:hypothetical protein
MLTTNHPMGGPVAAVRTRATCAAGRARPEQHRRHRLGNVAVDGAQVPDANAAAGDPAVATGTAATGTPATGNGAPGHTATETVLTQARPDAADSGPSDPTRRQLGWRWAARGIALVALAVTVMMVALGIGMRSNDAAIEEHLGSATATVLSVSPLRTGIEFVDVTGATIRPEGGVLYPGLLSLGQQFVVQYSTQDPQIARVAGRTAAVGNVMIALTLGLTYLIALPLIWWCQRRSGLPLVGRRRNPGRDAPLGTPARIRPHRPAR